MHEHLDEMGIIHMNGRIYDPLTGRFMSADPFIQAPGNLQSYNRYAYVMNNPLSCTDPSGYWSLKKLFKAVVFIAVVVYTGGAAASFMASSMGYASVAAATVGAGATLGSAMAVGAASGFAGSFMSSAMMGKNLEQSLKAGAIGAVTGAAFAGITYGVGQYARGLEDTQFNRSGSPIFTAGQRAARAFLQTGFIGLSTRLQGGSFSAGMRGSIGILAAGEAMNGMRQSILSDSMKNSANASGISEGWLGDGEKGGCGRVEALTGVAEISPLGGQQGGPRSILGIPYPPGSFADRLVEAYSGPHDFFNSWTYDGSGNYAPPNGMEWLANVGNYANVLTVTPFVMSGVIQAYAPSMLYRRK
jgi:RHS repeat-associated protein